MSEQQQPSLSQKEARIQLTRNAIDKGQFQSVRQAVKTYDVPESLHDATVPPI